MNTKLKKVEITRAALIEKMIEYRQGNWDASDTWEALYYGRNGFGEFTNVELEQQALDYGIGEEDGDTYVDVAYTITDADTHTVSEEERLREINKELVEALKQSQRVLQTWEFPWVKEAFYKNAAAIAKAEGRA